MTIFHLPPLPLLDIQSQIVSPALLANLAPVIPNLIAREVIHLVILPIDLITGPANKLNTLPMIVAPRPRAPRSPLEPPFLNLSNGSATASVLFAVTLESIDLRRALAVDRIETNKRLLFLMAVKSTLIFLLVCLPMSVMLFRKLLSDSNDFVCCLSSADLVTRILFVNSFNLDSLLLIAFSWTEPF